MSDTWTVFCRLCFNPRLKKWVTSSTKPSLVRLWVRSDVGLQNDMPWQCSYIAEKRRQLTTIHRAEACPCVGCSMVEEYASKIPNPVFIEYLADSNAWALSLHADSGTPCPTF
jgi:hypothetical protein